jgi:Domain of unknown function (DUF4440)
MAKLFTVGNHSRPQAGAIEQCCGRVAAGEISRANFRAHRRGAQRIAGRKRNGLAIFFQRDLAVVERILAPELIAIQQNSERWDDRTRLIALAKAMNEQGVQLLRLEFPRTEIQVFGDTAILYYTYIFESGPKGKSVVDGGRGTEVFVRRGGKWVDVGWHLDNGPFSHANGEWTRIGEALPAPSRPLQE